MEKGIIRPKRGSGRFNEKNFIELLKLTRDDLFSGKLLIKSREGFGTIFFREGNIVSASTPLLKEKLGDRLVRKGVLTEEQMKIAAEVQKRNPGRRLESILIDEGYLTQETLFQILKDVSEDVMFGMMFWNGVYRFEEMTPPAVPDKYLIGIDDFTKKVEGSLDDVINFEPDGLFSGEKEFGTSAFVTASGSDPHTEINRTLKDVAKSLTTFKPRELVIVVEDELLMRTIIADGLRHFSFNVEEYDNAKDALDRIQQLETGRISPAIILDLLMAGLYDDKDIYGGMDLLNFISQNFPTIPVIITTGVDDPQVRLKTQFLGASYFLNKPAKGTVNDERSASDIGGFIEELSYCLENIFRRQQAYLEKEQLASVKEELLSQILRKGNISFRTIEDILGAKILIIDDEKEICSLSEEFLRTEGFSDITIVGDSERAIEHFTERRHDVVVTDIVMPKKNGIEILKYVKTVSPNSQVIIVTGHADTNTSIAAVKLGAFNYIEKPIDFVALCEDVKRAVEMKLMLDEKI